MTPSAADIAFWIGFVVGLLYFRSGVETYHKRAERWASLLLMGVATGVVFGIVADWMTR